MNMQRVGVCAQCGADITISTMITSPSGWNSGILNCGCDSSNMWIEGVDYDPIKEKFTVVDVNGDIFYSYDHGDTWVSEEEEHVLCSIPKDTIEEMEREMKTERADNEYTEILRVVKGWWV